MKDFVKMTLAVICGLFIMGVVGFILFFGFVGALASLGNETPVIPRSGVLDMNLSKIILAEQGQEINPVAIMQGDETKTIGLWDAVQSIKAAAADPAVQYIFLRPEGLQSGIAQMEELRRALADFRASGKAVVSYIENPTTGAYYLASVADKVYMGNYCGGTSMVTGVGTQLIFLKDLLDKLGVNVQLIRHGKFKSAGEMYIKSSPSEENMLQNQEMINSIWGNISAEICSSRDITEEKLNSLVDNLILTTPEDFRSNGLVDELLTKEELRGKLTDLAVESSFSDLKMIPFSDYVMVNASVQKVAKTKVAIIFADGNIVDGDAKEQVAGDRFASIISKVREDASVKAVVLRVSSPGGSVLASEKIKQEIDLLRKEKPVIASYGNYAASGGYWISNSCDKIFSDPSTLTGSIGVFSMIPDFSKTAKDIFHVNVTSVGSNRHSDMYSLTRPLNAQETAYMQKSVNDIYDAFLKNVAEGRDMTTDAVDNIAQGRVWTGSDALKIGLVDEIGTLTDAFRYALTAAGIDESESYSVDCLPKPQTLMEMLLESFGGTTSAFAGTPFSSIEKAFKGWNWETSERTFARMPYIYEIQL